MNILDLHQYLAATFLPGIAITDPVSESIARAYTTLPKEGEALTDLPCVMMPTFELQAVDFKSAFIEERYAIRLQVFVKPVEAEQGIAAQMAAAFVTAIGLKLSDTQRLGGNVSVIRGLRGERETLTGLVWAGVPYVGADLWLDVTLKQSKAHSP